MPITIAKLFRERRELRRRAGEIPEMYRGDNVEAMPVATPPMKRAITNSIRARGRAAPIDEIVNKAAALKRTFFLPKRSLVKAARLAPTTHPRRRLLAAISV